VFAERVHVIDARCGVWKPLCAVSATLRGASCPRRMVSPRRLCAFWSLRSVSGSRRPVSGRR